MNCKESRRVLRLKSDQIEHFRTNIKNENPKYIRSPERAGLGILRVNRRKRFGKLFLIDANRRLACLGCFFFVFFFLRLYEDESKQKMGRTKKRERKKKETKPWEIKSKSGRILFQGSHYTVWRSNKKKKRSGELRKRSNEKSRTELACQAEYTGGTGLINNGFSVIIKNLND